MEQARRYSPDQLRRLARRAIEAVEPDQTVVDAHENELVRSEEQAAQDNCSLTLHDNGDGTTTGHFTVPALAASILAKVIDAMTAPRRMRGAARSDQPADRSFDWRHRRGLAFAELLEHLPTDHLHPRTAATVIVTIDHTVLAGALKAAHLDTDQTLSAGEARRLACGAAILPAVLGTKSVALDLGAAEPVVLRAPAPGQRTRTLHLCRDRLRTSLRVVRAAPPTILGPRRPDRPGQRDPAVPPTPPVDPRHRVQPPVHARRQRQIQQAHVMTTSMPRVLRMTTDSPIEIPRPGSGDVVELILEDHRLFEHLLRELRNEQNDRDALRRQVAELLVAHGEAEESKVYPQLESKDAIDEEEAEHGEKEHQEGYEKLLPLLEATELYDEEFSNHLHEFSETLLHHLDEEERDILNPAREDVSEEDRARLGAAWAEERNRMLDDGCASTEQVRALVDAP